MAFLIACPNCGERNIYEFNSGGEVVRRPPVNGSSEEWYAYAYGRSNSRGMLKEWWYHRFGCKRWFIAIRDTNNNQVQTTFLPQDDPNEDWAS